MTQMTSVERVWEYTKIKPEAEEQNKKSTPPSGWPSSGDLQFKNVFLAYTEDAGNVLKDINFSVQDKEKVRLDTC